MRKALVVYDLTGRVLAIYYGESELPQGVPAMWADMDDNSQIERIDLTDPENPVVVYAVRPETDLGALQKEVIELKKVIEDQKNQITTLQTELDTMTKAITGESVSTDPESPTEPE